MEKRSLFRRRDALFFAALLAVCALLFFLFSLSPKGTEALVERDGELLFRQELSQLDGPREIAVTGENGIGLTVTLYPDGAQVTASGCPDQICVQTGKITRAGESALCLPAKVNVRLAGGGSAADAATY